MHAWQHLYGVQSNLLLFTSALEIGLKYKSIHGLFTIYDDHAVMDMVGTDGQTYRRVDGWAAEITK